MTARETGKRLPTRDRRKTQQSILNAVSRVLIRDGSAGLGINAVAREAGVDKVLIYRYFGGLDELLIAFSSSDNFWPPVEELLAGYDISTMLFSARLQLFIDRVIDALRIRPLTQEILAMEISNPNALTGILNLTMENWGHEIKTRLGAGYPGDVEKLNIIITTLFAGIQYFLLKSRNTPTFGGIAIQKDEGWLSIKQSLSWLCERMIDEPVSPPQCQDNYHPPEK
jgi:AcrR family transcriptional regulator